MRVAVLGWGSLIWDPRKLRLKETGWQLADLRLPIEFSRISSDGRLTLVIDEESGTNVPVAFAESSMRRLGNAIRNLRDREGCSAAAIGVVTGKLVIRSRSQAIGMQIRDWSSASGFSAVIWTDLEPNFGRFGMETGLHYLRSLDDAKAAKARRYIALSPALIETRFRTRLRKERWIEAAKAPPKSKPSTSRPA
jgi:hypothetical protein